MCIGCNVVDQTNVEVMHLASQTNTGDTMIIPVMNNVVESYTFQVI